MARPRPPTRPGSRRCRSARMTRLIRIRRDFHRRDPQDRRRPDDLESRALCSRAMRWLLIAVVLAGCVPSRAAPRAGGLQARGRMPRLGAVEDAVRREGVHRRMRRARARRPRQKQRGEGPAPHRLRVTQAGNRAPACSIASKVRSNLAGLRIERIAQPIAQKEVQRDHRDGDRQPRGRRAARDRPRSASCPR